MQARSYFFFTCQAYFTKLASRGQSYKITKVIKLQSGVRWNTNMTWNWDQKTYPGGSEKKGKSWSEVKGESLFSFFKVLESRYTGNGCSTMHRVTTAKKLPELMKVMKSAVGRQSVPVLVMRQILSWMHGGECGTPKKTPSEDRKMHGRDER